MKICWKVTRPFSKHSWSYTLIDHTHYHKEEHKEAATSGRGDFKCSQTGPLHKIQSKNTYYLIGITLCYLTLPFEQAG